MDICICLMVIFFLENISSFIHSYYIQVEIAGSALIFPLAGDHFNFAECLILSLKIMVKRHQIIYNLQIKP